MTRPRIKPDAVRQARRFVIENGGRVERLTIHDLAEQHDHNEDDLRDDTEAEESWRD